MTGGIPLINPMHIIDGKICPGTDQTVTEEKAAELKKYRMLKNDVILGRRGEMGRCTIVGNDEDGMLCGTGSLYIRPNQNEISSLFLMKVLSSEAMKRKLESFSWGATMPNLNRTMIDNLRIPIPPLDLQRRFAEIVSSVEEQKAKMRKHLGQLDDLFASLQQRAFRGDL